MNIYAVDFYRSIMPSNYRSENVFIIPDLILGASASRSSKSGRDFYLVRDVWYGDRRAYVSCNRDDGISTIMRSLLRSYGTCLYIV